MKTKIRTIAVSVAVVAFAALVLGLFAAHWKIRQLGLADGYAGTSRLGRMMGQGKNIYPLPVDYDKYDQFSLPEDAAKSGEMAIIVSDLNGAKKGVADAAAKNGGSVYATFISYASDNIKNGSMVVQVPVANFDAAFSDLEKIASQIVQESIRQIPQRNTYPYPVPMMGAEGSVPAESIAKDVAAKNISNNETTTNVSSGASSSGVSAPASIAMPAYYPQIVQDKGYIKVIFADYGPAEKISNDGGGRLNIANMMGIGYMGQNLRNNLWAVLGVKSILLIVLIAIFIVIAKKIFQNLKKSKKRKASANVVKMTVKNRPKVVRIKNKKV